MTAPELNSAAQLAEARDWARHGFQVGQQSATWHSGHRKLPAWLIEGWAAEDLDSSAALRLRCEIDEANVRYRQQEARLNALLARWDDPAENYDDLFGVVARGFATELRKALEGDHTA